MTIQFVLGSFCVRNPKPHDSSNISRCEAEAHKLKKKVETIKDEISAHDDSLFSERTGKLQTGLTCHHKFNSDLLHLISTGIQENIAQKYKATYSIGSKTNVSKSRRKKKDKTKARSSLAVENRKSRTSVIFLSLGEGGHQLMVNMSQTGMESH